MKKNLATVTAAVGFGIGLALSGSVTASAAVTPAHVGDVCTVGNNCAGSASFVHDGDHLYVWDNASDGHSVVAQYMRSDSSNQWNQAWNHSGAGTSIDHNMDIPESGWIKYQVCLGEYGSQSVIDSTCSPWGTIEDAG
ncbi:MAG: hypothetical protein WCA46_02285 [Actinocatenispora sp.]